MAIRGVLEEELKNSLEMKKNFERELTQLPKGALIKKNIKGQEYYYLEKRVEGKIKFIYKGKISKEEITKYEEIKKYRNKYRKSISQLNQQIKFLRRSLRGKEAV